MLYTQKYHSLSDIDLEFIPTLESLLSENIPSFDWMKEAEKEIPEDIHFTYYLFFGNRHNAPVGFARLELKKIFEPKKPNFFNKFLKNSKSLAHKSVNWKTNFSFGEGLTFDPMYTKQGLLTANKILTEYQKRNDIRKQLLTFYQAYSELEAGLSFVKDKKERIIPHALIKSKATYQEYLQDLPEEIFKKIRGLWKEANKNFTLGEFHNFKEIFEYRNEGIKLLTSLKKETKFLKIKDLPVTYLTLEIEGEILAIVYLVKGQFGNYFYDFHVITKTFDNLLYHQMALLSFFEKEDSKKLHPMSSLEECGFFQELGFNTRKQWCIEIDHE